jgi:hypothetical protein
MSEKMNTLPVNKKIFSDIKSVSRGAAFGLSSKGVINDNNVVVPWVYLNPSLRDKELTDIETKMLILLETFRDDGQPPRLDVINRLVCYLTAIDKQDIRKKIEQALK